jgi:AraC-like DNA-binding protein
MTATAARAPISPHLVVRAHVPNSLARGIYLMSGVSTRTHIHSGCSLPSQTPPLSEVRRRSIYSRRLERLWLFIDENYSDPDIRLIDAAKHSGVSPNHLNALLHRFADTTFHALLLRYRVEKCLELLHEKNYTLTEIYSRCGFNSPTTFDRHFKKWVGCLPKEYKKCVQSQRGQDTAIEIFE